MKYFISIVLALVASVAGCQQDHRSTIQAHLQLQVPLAQQATQLVVTLFVDGKQLDETNIEPGQNNVDLTGSMTVEPNDDLNANLTLEIRTGTGSILLEASTLVDLKETVDVSFSASQFARPDSDGDGLSNWTEYHSGCEWEGNGSDCEWLQIAAGGYHTCAIKAEKTDEGNHKLYCWGDNSRGQLGLGEGSALAALHPTEVPLVGGNRWTQVTTGSYHTCAINDEQVAYCWGDNSSLQLGNGNHESTNIPGTISTGNSWLMMAAGDRHTCGITTEQKLFCWGDGTDGRLGWTADDPYNPPAVPTEVVDADGNPMLGWTYVVSGPNDICARNTDGGYFCFGDNAYGQLDLNGYPGTVTFPMPLGNGAVFDAVALGATHVCAQEPGNTTYCWGRNRYFQLAWANADDTLNFNNRSNIGTTYERLVAGEDHTCGMTSTGVSCWGRDGHGRLGVDPNGGTDSTVSPGGQPGGIHAVSAGRGHTCVAGDGGLFCWGSNSHGQLGRNSIGLKRTPTLVNSSYTWLGVTAGGGHTCAWDASNVFCWGANEDGQLGSQTYVPAQVVSGWAAGAGVPAMVSAGAAHTCSLSTSNDVQCWGNNAFHQVNGGTTSENTPSSIIAPLGTWEMVTTGANHSCAAAESGGNLTIYCWGANEAGQASMSDGATALTTPVAVDNGWTDAAFSSLSAGSTHSCVINSAGALECWGMIGSTPLAGHQPIGGSSFWTDISGGNGFACGVGGDLSDYVYCWGHNDLGQLGAGDTNDRPDPSTLYNISVNDFTQAVAGGAHACAARTGAVLCWGDNRLGQVGVESAPAIVTEAYQTVTDTPLAIAAGDEHTCTVSSTNMLYCWGNNYDGQLGTGDAWSVTVMGVTEP